MSISISQRHIGLPAMSGGAAAETSEHLSHHAQPVAGPYIGWDPVAFQKVGGFAGGIRSVSGVFRQAAIAVKGRALEDAASRGDSWGYFQSNGHTPLSAAYAYAAKRRFVAAADRPVISMPRLAGVITSKEHEPLESFDLVQHAHDSVTGLAELDDVVGEFKRFLKFHGGIYWIQTVINSVHESPNLEELHNLTIDDYIRAMCESGNPLLSRAIDVVWKEVSSRLSYMPYFIKFARYSDYARARAGEFDADVYRKVLEGNCTNAFSDFIDAFKEDLPDPIDDVYALAKMGVTPAAEALRLIDCARYRNNSHALRMLKEMNNEGAAKLLIGSLLSLFE